MGNDKGSSRQTSIRYRAVWQSLKCSRKRTTCMPCIYVVALMGNTLRQDFDFRWSHFINWLVAECSLLLNPGKGVTYEQQARAVHMPVPTASGKLQISYCILCVLYKTCKTL